jgi:hypothetical protein
MVFIILIPIIFIILFCRCHMVISNSCKITTTDEGYDQLESKQKYVCPYCRHDLKVFGKYKRYYIDTDSTRKFIILRRLICVNCRKTHVELPKFLVPYKHHAADTVQKCIDAATPKDFPAVDLATAYRHKRWFLKWWGDIKNFIRSCMARWPLPGDDVFLLETEGERGPEWLTKIVQRAVNQGFRLVQTLHCLRDWDGLVWP